MHIDVLRNSWMVLV